VVEAEKDGRDANIAVRGVGDLPFRSLIVPLRPFEEVIDPDDFAALENVLLHHLAHHQKPK